MPFQWVGDLVKPLLLSESKNGPAVRYFGMGWVALVCPARSALQAEIQQAHSGASGDQALQLLVTHPERYLRYVGDPSLAGKRITNLAQTMVVYDDEPRHQGGRCAAFLDGHAQWLPEEEWQRQTGGQPPDEPFTPEDTVRAFLNRAEAQEWDRLPDLCTSASQDLINRYWGNEIPFLVPAALLLQATPGLPLETGEWQIEGEMALVPVKKELALEFQYETAVGSYLDLLRLGQDTMRGGTLIHRLVGHAIAAMAHQCSRVTSLLLIGPEEHSWARFLSI